ncbi:maleylpyruvate isomerase family mycothiol-dependent enzyme [Streptomyces sp. ME19-01-6]|uniref:maleylpyruvate isomerase family mycothiol-dependent enzyme n=1 Tax=Streptomyces sp. ME19-01-6 TaxID=3028686 RepID=UPI0029BB6BEF|nr:maleylpyruvate isomerase family mycothiol-dependent enzyme [Streptomyces sp. ME19-01-6]MDX3230971.1 maleylpyruvate isomerase family mycothiol-dependent enzyme [Streptomyces sp. ME19-01-6]
MTDYARDAAAVRGATDRLMTSVSRLNETAVSEPSLLPGWTRGHVLAHLARNADALVNLLTWARTGDPTPMYPSEDARDSEIEDAATRPLPVHLDDLRTSAFRFNAAAAALPADRWSYEVTMRRGVVEQAGRLPFRRLVEVELHHVDLGVGYTLADLPAAFVEEELDFLTERFAGHSGVPPLRLVSRAGAAGVRHTGRAGGNGEHLPAVAQGEPRLTVEGSPAALLGWLTGRADGADLSCPDAPLPALPPLG